MAKAKRGKSQQTNGMEWWNATQDAHTRIAVVKAGGTWKNGQKTGETFKITALEVWMLTSADDIARINSYDPGMLCKGSSSSVSSGAGTTGTSTGATQQQNTGGSLLNKGKGLLNKLTTP